MEIIEYNPLKIFPLILSILISYFCGYGLFQENKSLKFSSHVMISNCEFTSLAHLKCIDLTLLHNPNDWIQVGFCSILSSIPLVVLSSRFVFELLYIPKYVEGDSMQHAK